jgi:parallel beta-helix repeat protein
VIGLAAAGGVPGAEAATADAPQATLYVDQSPTCSDQGTGTQATPFCTIQQAADVVNPGQTVVIGTTKSYSTPVTITRSGTATAPVTFTWPGTGFRPTIFPDQVTGGPLVTIKDAQYVTLSSLNLRPGSTDDGIDVIGSSHITLDQVGVTHLQLTTTSQASTGVSIDGTSSDVTVSRTVISDGVGPAIVAHQGSSGVTLTTNRLLGGFYPGITLDGSSGATITSNTVHIACGTATVTPDVVAIANGASATLENNLIEAGGTSCPPGAGLSVDASSAGGVTADYDALQMTGGWGGYSWAGVAYQTAAAFQASGVGQGGHDLDLPVAVGGVPPEGSPLIDSADCAAPGELSTDVSGLPRVDDPLVADSGNGTCHADRGASERQDTLSVGATPSPANPIGVAPFTLGLTVTSPAISGWNEPVSYTIDFGDGTDPVPATPGTAVSHQYATEGRYGYTITAADTSGSTLKSTILGRVSVLGAQPPAATLTAAPSTGGDFIDPITAAYKAVVGDRSWEVSSMMLTPGDGQSIDLPLPSGASGTTTSSYTYSAPGTYTATVTVTDAIGRTTTAKATITVGDELQGTDPSTVFSHTIAAHARADLPLSALTGICCPYRAALVSVIVTSPQKAGYVTIYPAGQPRTGLATVQFKAGQPAENSALAIGGGTEFYNASAGSITLTVVTYGLEDTSTAQGGSIGSLYHPVTPARVLAATRIAGNHRVLFPVAGLAVVPASAQSVVLDVTAWAGTAGGHVVTFPENGLGAQIAVPGSYWAKGQQVTGLATVPVAGRAVLANASPGATSFTAAVVGYYTATGPTGAVFLPVPPRRLLKIQVAGKQTVRLPVASKTGIPATSSGGRTTAVMVDLGASAATAAGTIIGWADGTTRPGVTSLSYPSSGAVAGAAIVGVGGDGAIDFYNTGAKPVTLTVDITGSYYAYVG